MGVDAGAKNTTMAAKVVTCKAIHARVKEILARDTVAEEQDFLLELLSHHGKHDTEDVDSVAVDQLDKNALRVVFKDGRESASFSWVKCARHWARGARGKDPAAGDAKRAALSALRNEVRHQTHGFRLASGFAGLGASHHVGHDYEAGPAFAECAEAFVRERCDGDWGRIKTMSMRAVATDKHASKRFEDRELAAAWQAYHERHCVLRMETAADNLRAPR